MGRNIVLSIFAWIAGLFSAQSQAVGQSVSIGVIGGGSVTDAVRTETGYGTRWWSQSKDWLTGVTFEMYLHSGFSLQVDGLYRELHATWAGVEPDGSLNSVSPSPVVTWEFPVLVKCRLGRATWRPFVEMGPSFRTTGNLNFEPSHYGVSAGAGLEMRWHDVSVAPALRYTRWAEDPHNYGRGLSQPNQLELLVGVTREGEANGSPLGQRMSVGAVAGWTLTRSTTPYATNLPVSVPGPGGTYVQVTATQNYVGLRTAVIGPAVEFYVHPKFSIEVNAISSRLQEKSDTVLQDGRIYYSASYTEASTWEFPVLPKYHFRLRPVSLFVEAGPSFRLPTSKASSYGATAGAGTEIKWRVLQVAPTLRFTHWAAESVPYAGAFARNEMMLMVGVSLGGPPKAWNR